MLVTLRDPVVSSRRGVDFESLFVFRLGQMLKIVHGRHASKFCRFASARRRCLIIVVFRLGEMLISALLQNYAFR